MGHIPHSRLRGPHSLLLPAELMRIKGLWSEFHLLTWPLSTGVWPESYLQAHAWGRYGKHMFQTHCVVMLGNLHLEETHLTTCVRTNIWAPLRSFSEKTRGLRCGPRLGHSLVCGVWDSSPNSTETPFLLMVINTALTSSAGVFGRTIEVEPVKGCWKLKIAAETLSLR